MVKTCFLCNSKEPVLDFNDDTFKNCLSKLTFRKMKNFKYGDVDITNILQDSIGYHSQCYKKVTVLKKVYNEQYNNFIAEQEMNCPSSATEGYPKFMYVCEGDWAESSTIDSEETADVDVKASFPMDLDQPSTSTATSSTYDDKTCLFCDWRQKKSGQNILRLVSPQEESIDQIKNIAESLCDTDILSKLNYQAVVYHKQCYAAYQLKNKRLTEEHVESSWHKYRDLHKLAFQSISNFIEAEIITNNRIMWFAQIFSQYQSLLLVLGEDEINYEDIKDYRMEMLRKKLLKAYGDQLIIKASTGPRFKTIIYKSNIDVSILASNLKLLETQNEKKFEDVAYFLRNSVKNMNRRPLPNRITADGIIHAECDIPKVLFDFMTNLIVGPDISEEDSERAEVKINCICSDIIYAITKGNPENQ